MKKYWLLFFVLNLFLFSACQDDGLDGLTMKYEETQCSNPWDALPAQGNYLVEVRGYLEERGIEVIGLTIQIYDENAGANCLACDCPSGRYVVINIPTMHSGSAETIGFVVDD